MRPPRKPASALADGARPLHRVEIVSCGCETRDHVGSQVGAERYDYRVARELPAIGPDRPRRRVDRGDLRREYLDPLPAEPLERSLNALRLAVADGEPEQRGLEQVLRLAVHEHDAVRARKKSPEPTGGDESTDAAAQYEHGLGLRVGRGHGSSIRSVSGGSERRQDSDGPRRTPFRGSSCWLAEPRPLL